MVVEPDIGTEQNNKKNNTIAHKFEIINNISDDIFNKT